MPTPESTVQVVSEPELYAPSSSECYEMIVLVNRVAKASTHVRYRKSLDTCTDRVTASGTGVNAKINTLEGFASASCLLGLGACGP